MKKSQRRKFILGALTSLHFLIGPADSMKPELVDQLDADLKARYGHALTPKSKAAVRSWPDQHFYLLRRLAVTGDTEVIKAHIGAGRAEVIAQEDLRNAREAIRALTANMARLQQEREEMRTDIASAQAERERTAAEVAEAQELIRGLERERGDALQRFASAQEAARVREEERDRAQAETARIQGLLDGALRTAAERLREGDAARRDLADAQRNLAEAQRSLAERERDRDAAQADARRIEALRAALERDLNDLRTHAVEEEARFMGLLTGRQRERDDALRQVREAEAEAVRLQGLLDGVLRTAAERMREGEASRRDLADAQRNLAEAQRALADRERDRDAAQADARRSESLRAALQREIDALRARTEAEEERLRKLLAETERKRDEATRELREAQEAVRVREIERDRAQAETARAHKEKEVAELARRSAETARAQVSHQLREMQTNILQGLNLTSADRRLVKELNRQLAKVTAEKEALQGRFRTLEAQLATFKSRDRAATEEARRAARAEGGEEKEESKIARLERELQLAHAKRDTREEEVSALRAEIAALKGERETLSAECRRLEREIQGAEAINQDKLVRVEKFLEGLQSTLGGAAFRLESPKSPHSRVTVPGSPLRREAASPRSSPRRWHGGGGIGEMTGKPRSP